jgi:hypothetical protein
MSKTWSTKMLLDSVFDFDLTVMICDATPEYDRDTIGIKHEYDRVIALLKAFDLYVKPAPLSEWDASYCEDTGMEEFKCFDLGWIDGIAEFITGDFILKRDNGSVSKLLQELFHLSELKYERMNEYYKHCNSEQEIAKKIFDEIFKHRASLNRLLNGNTINRYYRENTAKTVAEKLICRNSFKALLDSASKLDDILLKIIGEKEPVPETELIEKYSFTTTPTLKDIYYNIKT